MARINLLPWREERRKARQKEFVGMLGLAVLAGILLSILIYSFYSGRVSNQNARNDFLRGEITKVDGEIKEIEALDQKKAKLLARKDVIEQLQANRSQMVHLFDSLVRTIPDGVALTAIKQEGDILTLSGRSQSNARVSTYMRQLESSGWMTKPDLNIIEAKEGNPGLPYEFTLKVKLSDPSKTKGTDGAAPADAAAPAAPAAPAATAATAATAPAATAPAATAPAATAPAAAPAPAAAAPAAAAPAAPQPASPASAPAAGGSKS